MITNPKLIIFFINHTSILSHKPDNLLFRLFYMIIYIPSFQFTSCKTSYLPVYIFFLKILPIVRKNAFLAVKIFFLYELNRKCLQLPVIVFALGKVKSLLNSLFVLLDQKLNLKSFVST